MHVRHLLIAIAALAGLAAIAAAVFVASFDANRYKPELIELVRARTGRTLAVEGDISLALLPRIGLSLGAARLSGPGGRGEFARFDSARIGVALWPLLARRIVVDRIAIDGLELDLVRRRDGSSNFDDLLGAGAEPQAAGAAGGRSAGAAAAITIAGMQLHNATIGWLDEAGNAQWRLHQVDLQTSRIASGEPGSLRLSARLVGKRPPLDLELKLSGDYTIDFATRAARLDDLDLALNGRAPGAPALEARLAGSVAVDPASGGLDLSALKLAARSGDGIEVELEAPALAVAAASASGRPIPARLSIDRDAYRMIAALSLAAPTRSHDRVLFREVKAEATATGARLPAEGVKVELAGDAGIDPGHGYASLDLRGSIDGSALQARITASRLAPPALEYELQAGRIELDRGETAPGAAGAQAAAPGRDPQAARGGDPRAVHGADRQAEHGGARSDEQGEAPADALAVPALAGIDSRGTIQIGTLAVAGLRASNVSAAVSTGQGRIDVTRLSAAIYRGSLEASASLDEQGRHALRMKLSDVDAGMALRALAGRDVIEGRGNLDIDVTAHGRTVAAIERSLDGSAALALRNGAIKGVDLADVLARVPALLAVARGSAIEQSASLERLTAFSSLDARFVIRDGMARNDDLDLRSPLLRVRGAGEIDLARETVDYLARVSVADTLPGRGGTGLAALRGATIPVRLAGPFGSLSYRVDVADLAADTARRELGRRLEEALTGKPAQGGRRPASPLDALRGLLGR